MQAIVAQVRLVASFSDEQRSALLAAAGAVVYTPANEHFGIVPLEAMAAGRPVIACNSGGPTESIIDGKTGYLCDPEPAAFAAAMAKLLVRLCTLAYKVAHSPAHFNKYVIYDLGRAFMHVEPFSF